MDVVLRIEEVLKSSDAKSRDRRTAMTKRKMMLAVTEGPATRPEALRDDKSDQRMRNMMGHALSVDVVNKYW